MKAIRDFFQKLTDFIKHVAEDQRIPDRDKKLILAMVALVVSPLDIIPDWIPIFGLLDDLIILAIVLDYFFDVLDQQILLSHFPWSMRAYLNLRRVSRLITWCVPRFIKERIWRFESSPYRKG